MRSISEEKMDEIRWLEKTVVHKLHLLPNII
jgi:hypothetical protein